MNKLKFRSFVISAIIFILFVFILLNMTVFYVNLQKLEKIKDGFQYVNNNWTVLQFNTQNLLTSRNLIQAYHQWTETLTEFHNAYDGLFRSENIEDLKKKYEEIQNFENNIQFIWTGTESQILLLSHNVSFFLDSIPARPEYRNKNLIELSADRSIRNVQYYSDSINNIQNSVFLDENFQVELDKILAIVNLEIERSKKKQVLMNSSLIVVSLVLIIVFAFYNFSVLTRSSVEAHSLSENLQAALKTKDRFLAHISHELRTPLNGIIGMMSLLKDRKNEDQRDLYIISVEEAANQLKFIINELLDLSRMSNQKKLLQYTVFSLKECFTNIVIYFKPMAGEKNIRIIENYDDSVGNFYCDRDRLRQIINNLLINAVKYTDAGTVEVSYRKKGDRLVIAVTDTGIGISRDNLDFIFNEFVQLSDQYQYSSKGLGLGLTIVKRLVQYMNGQVEVRSTLGEGTCFTVILPFEDKNPDEAPESAEETPPAESRAFREGLRILIAEDDAISRMFLKKSLTDSGLDVTAVKDGEEVLTEFRRREYDMILIDINMPVKNGLETSIEIRKNFPEPMKSIPIIALTGHALEEDLENFGKNGINDVIIKPYSIPEILEKIAEFFPSE